MLRSFVLAGAVIAAPVLAQTSPADQPSRPLPYDLGHDNTSARSDAIAAESAPGVAAANADALAQSQATGAVNEGQYAADVAAYRAAMDARARTMGRDAAVQARNERAYALAMEDWRAQVRACDRGRSRACKAPAPDPANYW